jgi:hypothetical protein
MIISLIQENEDNLRAQLRKMDDAALRKYGTAARKMAQESKSPTRELFQMHHRVAQEVWKEKHTPRPRLGQDGTTPTTH